MKLGLQKFDRYPALLLSSIWDNELNLILFIPIIHLLCVSNREPKPQNNAPCKVSALQVVELPLIQNLIFS
jgi:hypothetical protein